MRFPQLRTYRKTESAIKRGERSSELAALIYSQSAGRTGSEISNH
jgi:hypothetical protein